MMNSSINVKKKKETDTKLLQLGYNKTQKLYKPLTSFSSVGVWLLVQAYLNLWLEESCEH